MLAALAAGCVAVGAFAQSEGQLRDRIGDSASREHQLQGQIGNLAGLERAMAQDVAVMQGRVEEVQAELTAAEGRVVQTEARLRAAAARSARLAQRLATTREKLGALLRERYVNGEPDLVTVVLSANGFRDLLETVHFVERVQHSDARLLEDVRVARERALAEKKLQAELIVQRREALEAVGRQRDALESVLAGLRDKQGALAQARAAREAALTRTRAGRSRAQKALDELIEAREQAAISSAGPGGPWAIPWAIVQCESGGQNLPPNSAGASGYYQFLPETWRGLGGSTPQAYLASKAEQDRLAAQLWAGGAGARNWVCASIVGAI
jgi:peptidoglycan hydrolase CwlO-like protein